jgi:hypothetical protein
MVALDPRQSGKVLKGMHMIIGIITRNPGPNAQDVRRNAAALLHMRASAPAHHITKEGKFPSADKQYSGRLGIVRI